jgi:molybdopterin-guanine dinucleotide biosynthesis protein A
MFADETRSYGLCSLMRVAAAVQIEKMLDAGQRRIQALPNHLNVKRLPVRRLAEIDPPQLSLLNVNTPADLERIAHISRFM